MLATPFLALLDALTHPQAHRSIPRQPNSSSPNPSSIYPTYKTPTTKSSLKNTISLPVFALLDQHSYRTVKPLPQLSLCRSAPRNVSSSSMLVTVSLKSFPSCEEPSSLVDFAGMSLLSVVTGMSRGSLTSLLGQNRRRRETIDESSQGIDLVPTTLHDGSNECERKGQAGLLLRHERMGAGYRNCKVRPPSQFSASFFELTFARAVPAKAIRSSRRMYSPTLCRHRQINSDMFDRRRLDSLHPRRHPLLLLKNPSLSNRPQSRGKGKARRRKSRRSKRCI